MRPTALGLFTVVSYSHTCEVNWIEFQAGRPLLQNFGSVFSCAATEKFAGCQVPRVSV